MNRVFTIVIALAIGAPIAAATKTECGPPEDPVEWGKRSELFANISNGYRLDGKVVPVERNLTTIQRLIDSPDKSVAAMAKTQWEILKKLDYVSRLQNDYRNAHGQLSFATLATFVARLPEKPPPWLVEKADGLFDVASGKYLAQILVETRGRPELHLIEARKLLELGIAQGEQIQVDARSRAREQFPSRAAMPIFLMPERNGYGSVELQNHTGKTLHRVLLLLRLEMRADAPGVNMPLAEMLSIGAMVASAQPKSENRQANLLDEARGASVMKELNKHYVAYQMAPRGRFVFVPEWPFGASLKITVAHSYDFHLGGKSATLSLWSDEFTLDGLDLALAEYQDKHARWQGRMPVPGKAQRPFVFEVTTRRTPK
jgi:hypothetical protein